MNVVPTMQTRRVAKAMVKTASETTGPDAVVRHLKDLEPGQGAALLGVLLNTVKVNRKPGRPRMPDQLTHAEMMKGYSQYRQGIRNDQTRAAYRQYQRTSQRRRRDAGMDPARNMRSPA